MHLRSYYPRFHASLEFSLFLWHHLVHSAAQRSCDATIWFRNQRCLLWTKNGGMKYVFKVDAAETSRGTREVKQMWAKMLRKDNLHQQRWPDR